MNLLTIDDLNTTVNHEPRIMDVRLAELLGFNRSRNIRQIIERNLLDLERFGFCCTVQQKGRGKAATVYYLNKKQALYICTLSKTPLATAVTIRMVEVFDEWMQAQHPASHPLAPQMAAVARENRKLLATIPDQDWNELLLCLMNMQSPLHEAQVLAEALHEKSGGGQELATIREYLHGLREKRTRADAVATRLCKTLRPGGMPKFRAVVTWHPPVP